MIFVYYFVFLFKIYDLRFTIFKHKRTLTTNYFLVIKNNLVFYGLENNKREKIFENFVEKSFFALSHLSRKMNYWPTKFQEWQFSMCSMFVMCKKLPKRPWHRFTENVKNKWDSGEQQNRRRKMRKQKEKNWKFI